METPIIVLIGAGASYASGRYDALRRPPLTRDLFRTSVANDLLEIYALAQSAGEVIERAMRNDTTLAFEQALLNLRTDGHAHHRRMSRALPLYLQALMLSYSKLVHAEARRYLVLVDELLKAPTHVHFVSLNYDTLLDYRLGALAPLTSMSRYIEPGMDWSLIKPHGSVNWFYQLDNPFDPRRPGELSLPGSNEIKCLPPDEFELRQLRSQSLEYDTHRQTTRYPAIALPEGPKDELTLPDEHLDYFTGALRAAQEVDLLVLGYSAIDTEVLGLLRSHCRRIRRLTVVNRDPATAVGVFATIEAFGLEPVWPDAFDGSYEDWVDRDGLQRWVAEYGGIRGGPYPSLTDPRALANLVEVRAYQEQNPVKADDGLPDEW